MQRVVDPHQWRYPETTDTEDAPQHNHLRIALVTRIEKTCKVKYCYVPILNIKAFQRYKTRSLPIRYKTQTFLLRYADKHQTWSECLVKHDYTFHVTNTEKGHRSIPLNVQSCTQTDQRIYCRQVHNSLVS